MNLAQSRALIAFSIPLGVLSWLGLCYTVAMFALPEIFNEINQRHFDGFLAQPRLIWNSRLRSSAGRFVPGRKRLIASIPAIIEVATYLAEEKEAHALVRDTIAHEMIHYWLWVRGRPYGHSPEFYRKMEEMGVSRYNPVPRLRPARYLYRCPGCRVEFKTRKKLGDLACASCCKLHAGGLFDGRFRLRFESLL